MTLLSTVLLWTVTLGVLVPLTVLVVECIAALLPTRQQALATTMPRPRLAALIPAHNEAAGISATLHSVQAELRPGDALVVVADNCDDDTATVAGGLNATVVERRDSVRRGKGYALAYGLDSLAGRPPDVVIMVDADCAVVPGAFDRLARLAQSSGRPVQAAYLLETHKAATPLAAISTFAFMVKNEVRPRGLQRLGLPCLLTGSGMAFPWPVLERVSLASGKSAEDMRLAVDLALAGFAPLFCAEAYIRSRLPTRASAARQQRARWEHGHLDTLLSQAPRLIREALRQRRPDLLALALELAVPPLSLVILLHVAALTGAVLAGLVGLTWTPALLLALGGMLLLLALALVWATFARNQIAPSTLLKIPLYILAKLPLYLGFFVRRQTASLRTERDEE